MLAMTMQAVASIDTHVCNRDRANKRTLNRGVSPHCVCSLSIICTHLVVTSICPQLASTIILLRIQQGIIGCSEPDYCLCNGFQRG